MLSLVQKSDTLTRFRQISRVRYGTLDVAAGITGLRMVSRATPWYILIRSPTFGIDACFLSIRTFNTMWVELYSLPSPYLSLIYMFLMAYTNTPWQVAKNPLRQRIWRRAIRYLIYATASLSSLSLVMFGTRNMWDLASHVPFLQNEARVLAQWLDGKRSRRN